MDKKAISKRISTLMYEHRISQVGLAETIGITQATLSRNINNSDSIKSDLVVKIAKFFNVTTDYLLCLSNEKQPPDKIVYKGTENSNSPLKHTPEYTSLIKLIDMLDRDQLIMLKGMILAIIGVKEEKERKVI